MKQTAVNWFANELLKNENIEKAIIENFSIASEYYNKAKEMEKEQIIEFAEKYANSDSFYCSGEFDIEKGAEQYYNETFKPE